MRYFLGILLLVAILTIVFITVLMILWNWQMPELFGLPKLTFWQTLYLWCLINCFISVTYTKSK